MRKPTIEGESERGPKIPAVILVLHRFPHLLSSRRGTDPFFLPRSQKTFAESDAAAGATSLLLWGVIAWRKIMSYGTRP